MKIFSSRDLNAIDQKTIEEQNIQPIELIERAAKALFNEFTKRWNNARPVVVFAGPGNNGADALALSRLLIEDGYQVETFLFNTTDSLSECCKLNKAALEAMENAQLSEVIKEFRPPTLDRETIVVDGLFGTGINKAIQGGYVSVINYINNSKSTIVSIDIPSGLCVEDNKDTIRKNIIHAHYTFTFQCIKLSFLFAEYEMIIGEVVLIDLGLSKKAIERISTPYTIVEPKRIKKLLHFRKHFSHKGTFGHALLVAGSSGMIGAALLAARACMRSGAGMLTVHAPRAGFSVLQSQIPEAKLQSDHDMNHTTHVDNMEIFTAVGFGPGIGMDEKTKRAVRSFIPEIKRPCVVDADGLNILAENKELLNRLPTRSILTPHPKEFDRLFGQFDTDYERLRKGMDVAKEFTLIIVIKGAFSAICTPDGQAFFNPTGNPGMATAGSGDVLTGIITGLLAQNYTPAEAAILGVYLHGLSADIALQDSSVESILASDMVENLGKAYRQLRKY